VEAAVVALVLAAKLDHHGYALAQGASIGRHIDVAVDPLIFRHIIDSYATRYREYSSPHSFEV